MRTVFGTSPEDWRLGPLSTGTTSPRVRSYRHEGGRTVAGGGALGVTARFCGAQRDIGGGLHAGRRGHSAGPRGRGQHDPPGSDRLRGPRERGDGQRADRAQRERQACGHGRHFQAAHRHRAQGPRPRVRRGHRRSRRAAVPGLRRLPQGDRLPASWRRGPVDDPFRLPAGPLGVCRPEGRERLHGEELRSRSGRDQADHPGGRSGREEESENRGRLDVPPFSGPAGPDRRESATAPWDRSS